MGLFDFSFAYSKSSGGGTNPAMSKDLMRYQSKQWRQNTEWFNKNGYDYLRQGLINADYNPILAIGSSPLNGEMPTATAVDPTRSESANMSATPSANMQANTARKVSESQIEVNKASADKIAEEALTQQNVRDNLDTQSALNLLKSEEIQRLLPLKERQMLADILVADSVVDMNRTNTAYVPYNAETGRINANAAKKNSDTNATWTPAKIAAGGIAGLITALGIGKFGKVAKPFMKNSKGVQHVLGNNGYRSSRAEYFTTLH